MSKKPPATHPAVSSGVQEISKMILDAYASGWADRGKRDAETVGQAMDLGIGSAAEILRAIQSTEPAGRATLTE